MFFNIVPLIMIFTLYVLQVAITQLAGWLKSGRPYWLLSEIKA
jgi:hypothetical protein